MHSNGVIYIVQISNSIIIFIIFRRALKIYANETCCKLPDKMEFGMKIGIVRAEVIKVRHWLLYDNGV